MRQEAGTMELTVVVPNDWEKCFIIFVKAAWIVLSAVTLTGRKKINPILPTNTVHRPESVLIST